MKKILNVSLGSDDRDFEDAYTFLNREIYVKRIGLNGDIEKFMAYAQKTLGFDAVAIGGINSTYYFDDKSWVLSEYQKLTARFQLPVYDGHWVKKYYEPYSLERIIATDPDLFNNNWLVLSALDRAGCYDYLLENNFDVSIGDIYAAFMIPIFPSRALFKIGTSLLLPIFSRMPIKYFYPHEKSDTINKDQALKKFKVILTETNFLLNKNLKDFKNQTIIFSRASVKDKANFIDKGCKIHTLLPGGALSANIIEAIVSTTIGFRNLDHKYIFDAIDNLKIAT